MKKIVVAVFALILVAPATQALAAKFKVEIINLTNANYFTPILVAAHKNDLDMFEVGESASAALQAIAEGGDVAAMQSALDGEGAATALAEIPDGAPVLGPGKTAVAHLNAKGKNRRLSLAAMILPTNDAFIGLDSIKLRRSANRTFYLYGYDAGTEANDELLNPGAGGAPGVPGIPGDPSGLAGTGGTGVSNADHNQTVHIHRGIIGDDDDLGGVSDLDRSAHRWLNPVARVVITRVHGNYYD
ncbi:MAG: spondin domain-containing protein [bacterium]